MQKTDISLLVAYLECKEHITRAHEAICHLEKQFIDAHSKTTMRAPPKGKNTAPSIVYGMDSKAQKQESEADRIAACLDFCRNVPTECLRGGIGVFVQAKMDFNERIIMPEVAEAIETLKKRI